MTSWNLKTLTTKHSALGQITFFRKICPVSVHCYGESTAHLPDGSNNMPHGEETGEEIMRMLAEDTNSSTKESVEVISEGESSSVAGDEAGCATCCGFKGMDGAWSWTVCMFVLLCSMITYGCSSTYGILFPSILAEFKAGRAITAFPGAIAVAFSGMLGPIGGLLIDRFGPRVMILCGNVTFIIGLVTSSYAPNIAVLYVTFGLVIGFGNNLSYMSSMLIAPLYFHKKRLLATAIMSVGPGASLLIMSPIVQAIFDVFNWRKTMLCMAALCFTPCLGVWLLRQSKRSAKVADEGDKRCKLRCCCDWYLFKDSMFLLCTVMTALASLGHSMPMVHLAKHCDELGISSDLSSWLYFSIGFSSLSSRMSCGKLIETGWLSTPRIFQLGAFTLALGNLLLPLATRFEYLVLYSIGYGFGEGFLFTPILCFILESVPLEKRGRGFGLFQFFISLPYVFGPALSGLIADLSGIGYSPSFYTAGALELVSMCMPFLIPYLPTHNAKEEIHFSDDSTTTSELIVIERESVV